MPYIKQDQRERFDSDIVLICADLLRDNDNNRICGEFNYIISRLAVLMTDKDSNGEKNYARLNAIIGAIECAKNEFYQRVVRPYEDIKIKENGDIL